MTSLYKFKDWIDINKLEWCNLSMNPNAIHLLEKNPDKIDWAFLSQNPNAIHLLEQNVNKIKWNLLLFNPNIFELNYEFLKKRMDVLREELMMKAWHPNRVNKWLEEGIDMEDF